MSNRPRYVRARRPRVDEGDAIAAALRVAYLDGCVCGPDTTVTEGPDGPVVDVGHDLWCPGYARPMSFVKVAAKR